MRTPRHEAQILLAELRDKGGTIRMESGRVFIKWRDGERDSDLAERMRLAKDEIVKALTPLPPGHDILATAIEFFRCEPITEDDDDDEDAKVRNQLDTIEVILAQRDAKGRPCYTKSQVDSCFIGLRGRAGTHPAVDSMLERLKAAKKTALTWQRLAERQTAGRNRTFYA